MWWGGGDHRDICRAGTYDEMYLFQLDFRLTNNAACPLPLYYKAQWQIVSRMGNENIPPPCCKRENYSIEKAYHLLHYIQSFCYSKHSLCSSALSFCMLLCHLFLSSALSLCYSALSICYSALSFCYSVLSFCYSALSFCYSALSLCYSALSF